MFSTLMKLFSHNSKRTAIPLSVLAEAETSSPVELAIDCISWKETDQAFSQMLLDVKSLVSGHINEHDKSSLKSMHELFLQDELPEHLVPRLPGIIPRLMLALRDSESSASDLTELLAGDVVLVSEVIQLANSAYYSRSQFYDSLEQAIVNIGFNGIRQIIVRAAMKPILNTSSGHFASIASGYLWDKSMYAGLLSDCAAKQLHENRFHAYLASLTMQSGMTMLSRELDKYFNRETTPRDKVFIDTLNHYALEISAIISRHWKFPEAVTSALQEQTSRDDPSKMSNLGAIIYQSDKLAKIHLLTKKGCLKTVNTDLTKRMSNTMADIFSTCINSIEEE